MVSVITQCR